MASNSVGEFSVPSVLAAMATMRTGDNTKKKQAHEYLAKFQKSVRHFWPGRLHTPLIDL